MVLLIGYWLYMVYIWLLGIICFICAIDLYVRSCLLTKIFAEIGCAQVRPVA